MSFSSTINFLRRGVYLTIPILCMLFWLLVSLIKDDFYLLNSVDFPVFYDAGKNIFTNPDVLYESGSYFFYLPSFALLFSLISLLEYWFAQYFFLVVIYIFSVLSLIEFDKILVLKNIRDKFIRFLFLMVISNGIKIMNTFDYLQPKFIALFLILLFLRREIKMRKESTQGIGIKFHFTQLLILIFTIGMVPSLFFIPIIYLFNNARMKSVLSKEQMIKYGLFILIFIALNFMFLIRPSLILDYIGLVSAKNWSFHNIYTMSPQTIINDEIVFPINFISIVPYLFNVDINISLASLILVVLGSVFFSIIKMPLEKKFGFMTLFSLFLNVLILRNIIIVLIPLLALLLMIRTRPIERHFKLRSYLEFIKNNMFFLFGLLILAIINFLPPIYYLYSLLSFIRSVPLVVLVLIPTLLYLLFSVDIYVISFKKKNLLLIA